MMKFPTSILSRTIFSRPFTHQGRNTTATTTMMIAATTTVAVLGSASFFPNSCDVGQKKDGNNDKSQTALVKAGVPLSSWWWSSSSSSSSSQSSIWSTLSENLSAAKAPMITLNHCQVPCGIFDDPAMVNQLKQSCTTIRKAIVESNKLHADYVDTTPLNANQFIRWVVTKEQHADDIIKTVSDYCLCQRVKRPLFKTEEEYLKALKVHHQVLQAAMKAKQSMDVEACDALEHAVETLSKLYTK